MSDFTDAVQTQVAETQAWKQRAEDAEANVAALREAAAIADKLEMGWHKPYTEEMARRQAAEADRDRLRDALEKIVACDYRGNMPPEQAIARAALAGTEQP